MHLNKIQTAGTWAIDEPIGAIDEPIGAITGSIGVIAAALSVLLDDHYPGFAEKMIFVAGERVITDPVAIPFSLGRHLLCIYSKRYIDHPPEKKVEKQKKKRKLFNTKNEHAVTQ